MPMQHVYYAQGNRVHEVVAPIVEGPRSVDFWNETFVNSPWGIRVPGSNTIFYNNPIRMTLVVTQSMNEYGAPEEIFRLMM